MIQIIASLLATLLAFNQSPAQANTFDQLQNWQDWQGTWELQSQRSCLKREFAEDPLFNQFIKKYSWQFSKENTLVENLTVEDKVKNRSCSAQITYRIEFQPAEADGKHPQSFLRTMILTRTKFTSKCLVNTIRPEQLTLRIVTYPKFIETYQLMTAPGGECDLGDSIVTQFKKVK